MAEQFASIIVEIVVGRLIDPITRQFSYLFYYKSNIKSLTDGIQDLKNKKDGVTLLVDAAERNLEIIGTDVKVWLGKVEENEKKAHEVLEGTKIVENGWCPNLKLRYSLSRKVVKQIVVVKELQKDGEKYTQFSYPPHPTSMVASTSTTGLEVFKSRILTTNEVIEALKNENISKIGICGLGGIGKTRMAKEILNRAIVENLFDEVAMANVSQNPDLKKIQDQLGSMLGLELRENDSTDDRAKKLRARLTQGRRILVILDDLWNELDLWELGIPVRSQGEGKGCKLLITSRNEHVCITMETQKNFLIQLLSHQEAWDLFKQKAGECVETTGFQSIAEEVMNECGRLPLAIVTVGSALRGQGKHAWKDALHQLKTSNVTTIEGMDTKVYASLRLSYDYLDRKKSPTKKKELNQLQRLFLLCCLFPEDYDIPVEVLVRYSAGLRILNDVQHLESARHRVQWLADQLKSCYLLLHSDKEGHVKMHDVLRDFGLMETSNGEHLYMVKHNATLKQWPQNDAIEPYTAISISSQEQLKLPPNLDYPSLQLLQFSSEGSTRISSDYFIGMKELKVVSVKGQSVSFDSEAVLLEFQPKSLQIFMNVRTLCLEECRFRTEISLIGSMYNLEILSFFSSSEIDVLPREIGQLKNLRLLDLRGCRVGLIVSGVLSRLKKLEDLYMGNYFNDDGVEERNDGNCASITELYSLSCLRTLQVCICEPACFFKLKDLSVDEITRFNISVSSRTKYSDYELLHQVEQHGDLGLFSNRVNLCRVDLSLISGTKLEALARRTEVLSLYNVSGWKNIIIDGYMNLKKLVIDENDDLVEICHRSVPVSSMDMLQKVKLRSLSAMMYFCRGQVQPPFLINLKVFVIQSCSAIRSLFSPSIVRCLVQLQKLTIANCMMLEEIVSKYGDENDEDANIMFLAKLELIKLDLLPRLGRLTPLPNTIGSDSRQTGSILNKVSLPNIETLRLRQMDDAVVKIVGGQGSSYKLRVLELEYCHYYSCVNVLLQEINMLQNLQQLYISECASMEAVFNLEEVEEEVMLLGQLHSMQIEHLPELRDIWKNVPKQEFQGFDQLSVLDIRVCGKLRYLLSSSMAKLLVNLQVLKISYCDMMDHIIKMDDENEKSRDIIIFPQLQELRLDYLERLTSFYEGNSDLGFPSLDNVSIWYCHNMNNFCYSSISAPKLEYIEFDNSSVCLMGDLNNTILHMNSRLKDNTRDIQEDDDDDSRDDGVSTKA